MPANGGTTCRFMRPRALVPPTVQLGNSGIDEWCVDVKPSLIDLDTRWGNRAQAKAA